jgi:hypothetical protein
VAQPGEVDAGRLQEEAHDVALDVSLCFAPDVFHTTMLSLLVHYTSRSPDLIEARAPNGADSGEPFGDFGLRASRSLAYGGEVVEVRRFRR